MKIFEESTTSTTTTSTTTTYKYCDCYYSGPQCQTCNYFFLLNKLKIFYLNLKK